MPDFNCKVNYAGPRTDVPGANQPQIVIMLSDVKGTFVDYWFVADDSAKREMLAVALQAISTGAIVDARVDGPNTNNNPYTQLHALYLIAPS